MIRRVLTYSMLLLITGYCTSQAQSPVDSTARVHSPRKATILSACLPGAGQVYNHKVWKVPILYAAFGGMAYLIQFNNTRYHRFNDALIARLDDDPNTVDLKYADVYTDANLKSLSDYYHRNRDLSIAITSLIYLLNIVDAHVDAHLFHFNTDDKLSMRISPALQPAVFSGQAQYQPGMKLSIQF